MADDKTRPVTAELTDFRFEGIQFTPGVPGRDASSTTSQTGNLTVNVNTAPTDPKPGVFGVNLVIAARIADASEPKDPSVPTHLSVVIPVASHSPADLTFAEIEKSAALSVPAILRAVADKVEEYATAPEDPQQSTD